MTQLKSPDQTCTHRDAAISEPIKTITIDNRNITILGTAHVSRASADKVQELIASGTYDAVAVELCPSRHKAIVDPDAMARMDLFQVIKKVKPV